jgi:S-DNA-T family DNA segregation ATPase FtsK/SpoIIIE
MPEQTFGRSRAKSTAQSGRGSSRSSAAVETPPRGTRRDRAGEELREAVSGREHEFWGIGFVALGVLLGLAIHLDLAGPLGRGTETFVGWLTGIGRFAVPAVFVVIGVTLIRSGQSMHPFRLAVGWSLTALSVLGGLHVLRGPESLSGDLDLLTSAGGWLGAAVGAPLRSLLDRVGALVVLAVLFLGGAMLTTGKSVREVAAGVARWSKAVAVPFARRMRRVADDMSTLRSERDDEDAEWSTAPDGGPGPVLYDQSADDDWNDEPEPPAPRRRTAPADPLVPPVVEAPVAGEQGELDLGPAVAKGNWKLPPKTCLLRTEKQTVDKAEVEARGRTLVDALATHGVETRIVGQTVGPTITRYELELGTGVKVARILNLTRDIAYATAAADVRILAPIPGRSAVGIEVENTTRHLVSLGDVMSSKEAVNATNPLDVAIGKDIAGRSIFLNLATTPHLLIAGATGAGKSSGINCIITSLLMRTTPDQVRLILIDPKQVEMGQYNKLPHLLTAPVTNPKKAANALAWAVKEMERRYDLLFEVGFRDILGYNAAYDRGELHRDLRGEAAAASESDGESAESKYERLPYIVVVVDELNDLMMVAARDVEDSITRIAQKARAVGIHLIVATQRPSATVITGVIKANIPARIAFAVSSLIDSRVILDQGGAEKLVGKGDMLMLPGNSSVSQRIQGCFVSEEEVRKVVQCWRDQAPEPVYSTVVDSDSGALGAGDFGGNGAADDDEDEKLVRQAMDLVVRSGLGSTSMLQRKLKVGFARAGRIMDLLEQRGVVGPSEGSKAREVLMGVEELELLQGGGGA